MISVPYPVFQIKCEDEHTGDEFTIAVNDWIRYDEEHDGWREFPVIWPGILPQESKSIYSNSTIQGIISVKFLGGKLVCKLL